jgi:hypothetical protein
MNGRRELVILGSILLIMGAMACGFGASATPTPELPTPTPIPSDTPAPTDTPVPIDTPTPEKPVADAMAAYEEPDGAFSIDHPAAFDDVGRVDDMGDLGYAFQGTGADALLFVSFGVLGDEGLTGFEWQVVGEQMGPELLASFGESFGTEGEFEEISREVGSGEDHTLYLEASASDTNLHMAAWLEEVDGVMAMVFWFVPEGVWSDTSEAVEASIDSFVWSPDVVRSLAPAGEAEGFTEDTLIEPMEESVDFVAYESDDGVFLLDYPAAFSDIDGPDVDEDGYVFLFQTADGAHFIGLYFGLIADTGLTDDEWEGRVPDLVMSITAGMADDAEEVYHEDGDPGSHWVYTEAESASQATRQGVYVEEGDGVLGMMVFSVSQNEWMDWEAALIDSLVSFRWSSDAARETLEDAGATGVVAPAPTSIPQEEPTPMDLPTIPAGKGGLIMLNCRSEIIAVEVLPDGIVQDFQAAIGGECAAGNPIFLDPGEHTLKASIQGLPIEAEAVVRVVAGEYLTHPWR